MATLILTLLLAAEPHPSAPLRLGAIFAGGVLDLMTEPARDVTASFGALISAPIGYPRKLRAAQFTLLARSIPATARARDPKLAADLPVLVKICALSSGGKIEAILQGRTHAWKMAVLATIDPLGTEGRSAHFMFLNTSSLDGKAAQQLASKSAHCEAVHRDAAGEVFFADETTPVLFEATPRAPWPAGSDHLLDFAVDPDLAVAGLMPAEVFCAQHHELPRPRAAGVLSLVTTAEAFPTRPSLTLVAWPPTESTEAVLLIGDKKEAVVVGFRNGYFTTPRVMAPSAAITGPWSRWSWSLVEERLPAEVLLDLSPAAAACLDGLQKNPDANAIKVQQCFDLSLADAGASFRVRRERWLEPVKALETAAAASVELFCADQGVLAALPFFQPRAAGKNRDAGPFLTAVLGWESGPGRKNFTGSLKLPAELEKKFSVSGFMELPDKELVVDTSFFQKLADFDRWELVEGGGPLIADGPMNAAVAPLPQFAQLTLAARLHLRRGVKTGKLAQASREVREAARLCFSTETYAGQNVGSSLLTLEWRAWDWARKNKLAPKDWVPLDELTIERVERVARTAPAFFSPMANEATAARAKACDRVTQCAALTEVIAVNAGMETLLREPWGARYRSVLETIRQPQEQCSFALARYWASRPMIGVAESKQSRNQEVIAGGMMSAAATGFYLPALSKWYSAPVPPQSE